MESKGAMDGPRYESKGAMQRFGYGFVLKIVVGRRSVGDGHGAWGRTSIWAWGPQSAAGAGESRRPVGARGMAHGRGRCSARKREERARERVQSPRAGAGSRARGGARVAVMGGKGKAHRIHGNDGQLHNAHGGWFLRHRSKRRLSVYVRRRFLFLPSLSSTNTLPHQQKSINRGVINRHRNHCRVCIGSALTKLIYIVKTMN